MSAPQCWAFNKQRQRCEMHPGHEDEHRISVAWTDDECFDPEMDAIVTFVDKPVPFVPTTGGSIRGPAVKGEGVLRTFNEATGGFDDTLIEEDADLLGETGKCFSCGYGEADHDSNPHGCRTYVP